MNDSIQNILDAIEAARLAGTLNNDSARAASVALGLEGDDAMLANRLIAQGSDPASLEYVATGSVSAPVAHAHRNGPGSLEGEDRRSWLLLAALSVDESQDSTLRKRTGQFAQAVTFLNEGGLWCGKDSDALIAAKEAEIRQLPHALLPVGGPFLPTYKADLGFAAAYWSGASAAAVIGSHNGETYVAVGSNGTPLVELGITVDKPIAPCFGIIEDAEAVKRIVAAYNGNVDPNGNKVARSGYDRCSCGCKYWEHDRCIDCGFVLTSIELRDRREAQQEANA
ncbi:MAG TPA: hypothetical protein VFH61_01755 [Thermoleophilia bacterium]|nr:hypothetical protein [Thermoleophilia bacterium]